MMVNDGDPTGHIILHTTAERNVTKNGMFIQSGRQASVIDCLGEDFPMNIKAPCPCQLLHKMQSLPTSQITVHRSFASSKHGHLPEKDSTPDGLTRMTRIWQISLFKGGAWRCSFHRLLSFSKLLLLHEQFLPPHRPHESTNHVQCHLTVGIKLMIVAEPPLLILHHN